MVSKSKPDKEVSAITDLLKSKVYVTPSRYKELIELKDAAWSELPLPILGPERSDPAKQAEEAAAADVTADQPATLPTLMCINLSEEIEAILQRLPYTIQVEFETAVAGTAVVSARQSVPQPLLPMPTQMACGAHMLTCTMPSIMHVLTVCRWSASPAKRRTRRRTRSALQSSSATRCCWR